MNFLADVIYLESQRPDGGFSVRDSPETVVAYLHPWRVTSSLPLRYPCSTLITVSPAIVQGFFSSEQYAKVILAVTFVFRNQYNIGKLI